jgi:hypothetical protein
MRLLRPPNDGGLAMTNSSCVVVPTTAKRKLTNPA